MLKEGRGRAAEETGGKLRSTKNVLELEREKKGIVAKDCIARASPTFSTAEANKQEDDELNCS